MRQAGSCLPLAISLSLSRSVPPVGHVIKFHSLGHNTLAGVLALSQYWDRAAYSGIGALVLLFFPSPPPAQFYGKQHLIGCHDKFPPLDIFLEAATARGEGEEAGSELTLCQILSKSSSNFDGLSIPAESSCPQIDYKLHSTVGGATKNCWLREGGRVIKLQQLKVAAKAD